MMAGEYGNFIRIQTDENITTYTNALSVTSGHPFVITKELSPDAPVGLTTVIIDGITFVGGQYVEYEIQEGDIDQGGEWEVCLHSVTPTNKKKILTGLFFTVGVC